MSWVAIVLVLGIFGWIFIGIGVIWLYSWIHQKVRK